MRRRPVACVALAAATLAAAAPADASLTILRTVTVKRGPAAIAFDPATNFAWVGSITDDTLTVFAGVSVVAEIRRQGLNPSGIAVDAAGGRVLVASFASNAVEVFSSADRRLLDRIEVPGSPWGIDVDPVTGRAFVARFADDALAVVGRDGGVSSVPLPGCDGPIGVAYSRQATRVLVTCLWSGDVAVVDAATLSLVTSIRFGLGTYPWGIAAHPAGTGVYVARWGRGSPDGGAIAVVDAALGLTRSLAFTGGEPIGVAVSPGGTPYATMSATNRLAVLDPASGAIVESAPLPVDPVDGMNEPHAVAVHPSGRYAMVGNFHAESVSFLSTLPYL